MTTREEVKKALALVQCRMVVTPEDELARLAFVKRKVIGPVQILEKLLEKAPEEDLAELEAIHAKLLGIIRKLDKAEAPAGPVLITAPPKRAAARRRETKNAHPSEEPRP